jgi:hypothetical protein
VSTGEMAESRLVNSLLDILGSDAVQLRAPFFMAAMLGAMGWSIAWLVRLIVRTRGISLQLLTISNKQILLFQFSVAIFRFRRSHQADCRLKNMSTKESKKWRHRHIPLISGSFA